MTRDFKSAWEAITPGQGCCYCRIELNEANPPTFDHVIPKQLGGTRNDGLVVSCQRCNAARGGAGFEEYMAAVLAEWASCAAEERPYRRPKWVQIGATGEFTITTLSKRARKDGAVLEVRRDLVAGD